MATSDDASKVSVGFTGEREREADGGYKRKKKRNKKDNFGKSLDPGQS